MSSKFENFNRVAFSEKKPFKSKNSSEEKLYFATHEKGNTGYIIKPIRFIKLGENVKTPQELIKEGTKSFEQIKKYIPDFLPKTDFFVSEDENYTGRLFAHMEYVNRVIPKNKQEALDYCVQLDELLVRVIKLYQDTFNEYGKGIILDIGESNSVFGTTKSHKKPRVWQVDIWPSNYENLETLNKTIAWFLKFSDIRKLVGKYNLNFDYSKTRNAIGALNASLKLDPDSFSFSG